jgi:hypothetical protein
MGVREKGGSGFSCMYVSQDRRQWKNLVKKGDESSSSMKYSEILL